MSIANLGDITGNGYDDLAVGAPYQGGKTSNSGTVYILFMEKNGVVESFKKINDQNPVFSGTSHSRFGNGIAYLGDLAGDGGFALAVGEPGFSTSRGAVWILFLGSDGSLKSTQLITEGIGGFTELLKINTIFGLSVTHLGDIDGDGITDIAVGAPGYIYNDSTGNFYGAVWILFLNADGTVKDQLKIGNGSGNFTGQIFNGDRFGWSVARIPDLDGDGVPELAVGATGDDEPTAGGGAVYILYLKGVPQVGVKKTTPRELKINIYPNPVSDKLHLRFEEDKQANRPLGLRLHDALGRLIAEDSGIPHFNEYIFDISKVSVPGFYYLSVEYEGQVAIKKVMIK